MGPADVHNRAREKFRSWRRGPRSRQRRVGQGPRLNVVFCQLPPYAVSQIEGARGRVAKSCSGPTAARRANWRGCWRTWEVVVAPTPLLARFGSPVTRKPQAGEAMARRVLSRSARGMGRSLPLLPLVGELKRRRSRREWGWGSSLGRRAGSADRRPGVAGGGQADGGAAWPRPR